MVQPDALALVFDYAQPRLARHRIAATAFGLEWDHWVFSGTYIDPVTDTLMFLPSSLFPDYHNSNSGLYAKVPLSDMTVATPTNWKEVAAPITTDGPFITNEPTDGSARVNEEVRVTTPIGKNRGFCLSVFNYSAGSTGAGELIQFGVNTTASLGREFRLYTDGTLEYWLDNQFQRLVKLKLPTNRQYLDITVLPFRKREILVLVGRTEGAIIPLDDIPEDAEDSEVWSATDTLYWYVPQGVAKVQTHILQFESTGFATTASVQFGKAPATGSALETWANPAPAAGVSNARVLADPAYAGTVSVSSVSVVQNDGTSAFTPNGTARDCRLRINLASDGQYTPFVYGVHLAYENDPVFTEDAEVSVLEYAKSCRLEVSDECGGCRLSFELDGDAAEVVPGLLNGENRPVRLKTQGETPVHLFDGVTVPPEWSDAIIQELQRYQVECRDLWRLLERHTFRDRVILDGLPLSHSTNDSCVGKILEWAGVELYDLDDVDFTLPAIPRDRCTDGGNFVIEVGETAASVLERLREDYAAGFLMGFKPTTAGYTFWFKDPLELSTTPVLTLYRTPADAEAALIGEGMSADDAARLAVYLTYDKHRVMPMPVEANEVWVSGFDPRRQIPLQSYYIDEAAQDPTLAPEDRPDNWSGDELPMGVIEPRITSQAACDRCASELAPLVTARRYTGEWECNGLPLLTDSDLPLWRWDVVRLKDAGENGEDIDYRISSLWCESLLEKGVDDGDDMVERNVGYTGVRVGTGHPRLGGGTTIAEQAAHARLRMIPENRIRLRPQWEQIAQGRPVEVVAVP